MDSKMITAHESQWEFQAKWEWEFQLSSTVILICPAGTKAIFQPASDCWFLSVVQNSDHMITFFWFCGFKTFDHVTIFLHSSHGREKYMPVQWRKDVFCKLRFLQKQLLFVFSCKNTWSKDLYFVVLAMLFTFRRRKKEERIAHLISIFETAEPQKFFHVIRIF